MRASPRIRRLRSRIDYLIFIIKHVKAWRRPLLWRLGVRQPFRAVIRGETFEVKDGASWQAFSNRVRQAVSGQPASFPTQEGEENGLVRIDFNFGGRPLRVYCQKEYRDDALRLLRGVFGRRTYGGLDVEGRDVLDIGANIGDSAIYFAVSGARRVIALELFASTFEIARMNIEANQLSGKILLLNEGAGSAGVVRVDPKMLTGKTATMAKAAGGGLDVRVSSLRDLVSRFSLDSAALKINCEGCEYDLLLRASADDLSHFQTIALEYHYGARRLSSRLRKAGFAVKTLNNVFSYDAEFPNPRCESGYIFAKH